MTLRFVIIAGGDHAHRHAVAAMSAARERLSFTVTDQGVTMLSNQSLTRLTPAGPTIVGDAFRNDWAARSSPRAAPAPAPAWLLAQYWGRYVAVWGDTAAATSILRDPSGAVPCHYRSAHGGVVLASELGLLERATAAASALDWDEIARLLVMAELRSPATALAGISELLPGHLLHVDGAGAAASPVWSPWAVAQQPTGASPAALAAGLRDRIDGVIATFAGRHNATIASISGGLDSSIVALSLARSARSLTCVTLATDAPSGDERRYARLVADAARCGYEEYRLDARRVDISVSQAAHLPRPIGRSFLWAMTALFVDAARAHGASAIVNGTGGDNIFCFLPSATPVADRASATGIAGALATIGDIADLTGASWGEVAVAALRRARRGRRRQRWHRDERFIAAKARAAIGPDPPHPWLDAPRTARLGTRAHVASLLRIQNYLDPWQSGMEVEVINPLLAQPVVEWCLAIPSWEWCRGGADRAVARRAYADLLPAPIQRRRWKGGPDHFIGQIVALNRERLRTMLCDGLLAARDLIDRDAIAALLADPRAPSASEALRLLSLADAEAWVRGRG